MCGICGIVNTDRERPIDTGLLTRMRDTLVHRGPDDAGIHISPGCGLAHRRLSIIDLSPDGVQPLSNEDGTIWITFNGEIYNYPELRKELEARGHKFRSRTDTETVIHLYEELGPECVHRLRGMFAFAIWDERDRTLVLARDRVGIKPLYYSSSDDTLVFGSELRALLQHPTVGRDIDPTAIDAYLSMLFVPGSQCIFRGVEKLPAGSYAVWRNGGMTITPYWDITQPKDSQRGAVDLDHLQELLENSIRERLISDVPLGVFLSGGIDSSLITALAARVSPDPVKTFTISFDGSYLDEAPYARMVSEQYGTVHTEERLGPGALTPDLVNRITDHLDEPFADASVIPTFLLSEMTRKHVTVALAGDGGDELFAGYQTYVTLDKIMRMQSRIPSAAHGLVAALAKHGIGPLASLTRSERLRRIGKALEWLPLAPLPLLGQSVSYWSDTDKERLYADAMSDVVRGSSVNEWFANRCMKWDTGRDLPTCLYGNFRTTLVDDMLVKVDRMSMYHALEVRVPLLDHTLAEYAATIRPDALLRDGVGKLPLRQLAERLLPSELINRPKQGFHVPLEILSSRGFSELIHDTLAPERIRRQGYFNSDAVDRAISDFEDTSDRARGRVSRYQVNHRLWTLLVFTLWHDKYSSGIHN
jgi:asparagine synthase (glutamine-hydrolysing)